MPRLLGGVDLTGLPLTPLEGFVLSRIDGTASLTELADLTSLELAQVTHIVEKLLSFGVVEWARESVSLPKATGRTVPKTPARPFRVPALLESPVARVQTRRRQVDADDSNGRYSAPPPPIDHVETERTSKHASGRPRASHTGSMFPAGELDDDTQVGSLPPPVAEALSEEADALLAEVERATRSGNYALPTLDEDDDESIDALDEGALPVPDLGSARPPADPPEPAHPTEASPSPVERPRVVVPRPAPFEPSEPPPAAVLADPAPRASVLPPNLDEGTEPSPPVEETASAPSSAPPQTISSEAPEEAEPESSTPAEASSAAPESAPPPPEAEASNAAPESAPAPSEAEGPIAADASSSEEEEEEDGADLAPERRERIAELYFAIELMDHYDVLGVDKGAKRKEIRTAYFALSKQFHPDTMFRKRLGTYKAKMEAIFHRLTEAYDVLGKKKPRAEYDRYLGLLDRTRSVEETISEAPEPAPAPAVEPEPDPTPPADSPLPETTRSSAAAIARRRQLMAEKLRRAARASAAVSIRTIPPSEDDALIAPEIPAAQRRDSVLQSLKRGLRESAVQTGGPDPIRRHLSDARRHEDAERLEEAMASLRFAAAIDPTQTEVSAELKRVTARLAASLAETYEAQARYEQEHGKWAAAAISWARVFEGRPDDADAARNAADAIVSANGDLRKARLLAQSAFELAPSDLPVLRTLARVYLSAGLETSARGVLERALELEPDDPAVRALVSRLEG